jgi:hypothetical protein
MHASAIASSLSRSRMSMRRTSRDDKTCSRICRPYLRPDSRDEAVRSVGIRRVLVTAQKENGRLPTVRLDTGGNVDRIRDAADAVTKSHAAQVRCVKVRADESLAGKFRRTILGGYYCGNVEHLRASRTDPSLSIAARRTIQCAISSRSKTTGARPSPSRRRGIIAPSRCAKISSCVPHMLARTARIWR